ncbi:MAG: CRISPR-associated endonuclease Cas2 [Candidatus Woesearchaeota archaeon]
MIILTYDIEDNSLRTEFSKFLLSYGRRLQYSVFEIDNSQRILDIVILELKDKFEKRFKQSDSVLIFRTDEKKVLRFGYAKNEESDLIMN